MTVVPIEHNRLDFCSRQLRIGYELSTKGGADWVEGSLQAGSALREAVNLIPNNISFAQWLKINQLDFYPSPDRVALIKLVSDPERARQILTNAGTTSYRRIWGQHAAEYSTEPPKKPKNPRGPTDPNRKYVHANIKLGADNVAKIKGTSLDRADELQELIMLNRGTALGELTDVVRNLIADAAAGKDVSAIATTKHLLGSRSRTLQPTWRKRMIGPWEGADFDERKEFIDHLVHQLPQAQRELMISHLMEKFIGRSSS